MPNALIVRPKELAAMLCLSRTGLYDLVKRDNSFPSKIQISGKVFGWKISSVEQWLSDKEGNV